MAYSSIRRTNASFAIFWMGKFSCRERWEEPSVESYGLASEQSNISLYVN